MKKLQFYIIVVTVIVLLIGACSTDKNTAYRRFYHNTTTKYNVYFNGNESFKNGVKKLEEQTENYTILLPIYKSEREENASVAASDMDLAVQKAVKAIKTHSITVKPERKKTKKRQRGYKQSKEQKEFYNKNEYNKYIDDAYLLIGKAHYYKQDYRTGMKSLQLILNKFRKEPVRFDAMFWIARSYGALLDFKETENYLGMISSDKEHPEELDYKIDMAYADIYIKQKQYKKAIDKLVKIIENTKKKRKKARLKYILAQLHQKLDNGEEALRLYAEVIKMNPPYEMAFSAKINMANSLSSDSEDATKLKKSLLKMLNDDKNIEYRDQIYYALAEISMKEENKEHAVEYYKLSAETSVSNVNQQALSFIALGDIYFEVPDYMNSGAYYDSAMSVLDKKYPEYDVISKRAGNLKELIDNLKIITMEDSLQRIAGMDSSIMISYINGLIQKVKADEQNQRTGGQSKYDPFSGGDYRQDDKNKGKWIIYNPQALSIGRSEFNKLWGKRKLEDHWRRKNKAIIAFEDDDENAGTDTAGRVTDNKKVKFYLQDLPLNDSLIKVSNQKIAQALFNAGIVYEKKMEDYPEAEKSYEKLIEKYPKNRLEIETYFNLYLMHYKHTKNNSRAEYYRKKILKEYSYSKYAKILSDPNYIKKLKNTKEKVDILYESTYTAYKNKDYDKTISEADKALLLSPQNELEPKFWYFKALALGCNGEQDKMKNLLEEIIVKYENNEITPKAQEVIDVINSGKFAEDYYTKEGDEYYYEIVVENKKETVDKVKFWLTNYNVDAFPETKFDIKETKFNDKQTKISVKSMSNISEAQKFINGLISGSILKELKNYKHFIITKENYAKLQKLPLLEKYLKFYKDNY